MKHWFTAVLICISLFTKAQAFGLHQYCISTGYGTTSSTVQFLRDEEYLPIESIQLAGPLFLKMEYAIDRHFGIGLNFSTERMNIFYYNPINYNGSDNFIGHSMVIYGVNFLARFNYHPFRMDKFDPYIGAALGYRKALGREMYLKSGGAVDYWENNPFGAEVTAGFRYYFCPAFALYAEGGLGMSEAQAGIVYRFGTKMKNVLATPKY